MIKLVIEDALWYFYPATDIDIYFRVLKLIYFYGKESKNSSIVSPT